jgi:hypothetical protein
MLTKDEKIAEAIEIEGAAFRRSLRAQYQCRVNAGGGRHPLTSPSAMRPMQHSQLLRLTSPS